MNSRKLLARSQNVTAITNKPFVPETPKHTATHRQSQSCSLCAYCSVHNQIQIFSHRTGTICLKQTMHHDNRGYRVKTACIPLGVFAFCLTMITILRAASARNLIAFSEAETTAPPVRFMGCHLAPLIHYQIQSCRSIW